jgi:hypothetical protein
MEELMDSLDKKAYRFGSGSCSALIKIKEFIQEFNLKKGNNLF